MFDYFRIYLLNRRISDSRCTDWAYREFVPQRTKYRHWKLIYHASLLLYKKNVRKFERKARCFQDAMNYETCAWFAANIERRLQRVLGSKWNEVRDESGWIAMLKRGFHNEPPEHADVAKGEGKNKRRKNKVKIDQDRESARKIREARF